MTYAASPALHPEARYYLRRESYVASLGRHICFLDLSRNKYHAVQKSLIRLAAPNLVDVDDALLELDEPPQASWPNGVAVVESLVAKGLLTADASSGKPFRGTNFKLPTKELRPSSEVSSVWMKLRLLSETFVSCRASDKMIRTHTIQQCIADIAAKKSRLAERNAPMNSQSASLIRYLLYARFYYPADIICFRDSYALMTALLRLGIRADWVFAVQPDPFAAHCWVQIGDTAINDYLERTNTFRPIMVI